MQAEVLSKATEYILDLERTVERMKRENEILRGKANMDNSTSASQTQKERTRK
jgi:hypothetical protein